MNVTQVIDELTTEVLKVIREYEFKHDTNIDCTVRYGHYANEIELNNTIIVIDDDTVLSELLSGLKLSDE